MNVVTESKHDFHSIYCTTYKLKFTADLVFCRKIRLWRIAQRLKHVEISFRSTYIEFVLNESQNGQTCWTAFYIVDKMHCPVAIYLPDEYVY